MPIGTISLALLVLALDQATKWLALRLIPDQGIEVTPFLNLVLVWNRGISFGMFSRAPDWGPLLLIAMTLTIAAALLVWLAREPRRLSRLAIQLVLAGAAGNLVDRLRFGAVVDFLDFHLAGYHWPAFNVADSAIVIGAGLLLLDGVVLGRARSGEVTGRG